MNQHSSNFKKYYSPLIGAALATASLFHFALPVLSIGTSAGTSLINSATATYDDQDNNSYEVTSNEVTVTVGKIAGITNVPIDFNDNTSSATNTSILPGDSVSFDFEVTNTGNDATNIFIPETGNIAVNNLTVNSVEISTDGGATFVGRNTLTNGIVPNVAENTSIIVRVNATVSNTAVAGDDISVQLGDTGTNTPDVNSTDYPGTQNQPDLGATGDVQATDIRTETAPGATVAGDPVNGQREASATEVRTIGSQSLALPRLEKTNAGVDPGTFLDLSDDADPLSDNIITYNLELDVASNTDPTVSAYPGFLFNAEALAGRDYSSGTTDPNTPAVFNGVADTSNLILISDAIPEDTNLEVGSVVAPAGGAWTPVYTESALTVPADNAEWTTTAPATQADANNITRVGWVYDARTAASGSLAVGSTTTGFGFDAITTGIVGNTATAIYNMGQVFGSTDDGAGGTSGLITYDESGDQNPTNLNDDGTFGPDETAITTVDRGSGNEDLFGFADPGTGEDNVDENNNNTETGSAAGEVNKVVVTPEAVVSDLFNGPDGNADAVGDIFGAAPADDNHDFQNLSADIPASTAQTTSGVDGAADTTYDPARVDFTNTVSNPSTAGINNIVLQPISPDRSNFNLNGDEADLPVGTSVRIIYDDGVNPVQDVTYTYDPGAADIYTIDNVTNGPGTGTGPNGEVVIPNIPLLSEVNYEVRINLPAGTELSTSFEGGDPANDLVGAYPAVIAAYIDDGTTDDALDVDDTYNITVNQVYTGYLQLLKKARVLRDDGSGTFAEVAGMGFNDPDGDKEAAPGDLLEYQITYTNISDDGGSGTGNGLLQADDVVITEDGIAGDNNWAEDNDSDTFIDTLHPQSGANDTTTGSVITYFDINDVGSTNPGAFSSELTNFDVTDDIVKYEVSGITRLSPGDSGVFTFQRKITSPADIEDLTP
ncbi:MAG: hypothetical protein AAGF83_10905 [Cyanobacteria bacterium P01_G01_bin.67]